MVSSDRRSVRLNVPHSVPTSVLAQDFMVTKLVTLSPKMDALDAIRELLAHRISGSARRRR